MRLTALALLLAACTFAQERTLACESRDTRDPSRHCEIREFTVPATRLITVDAGRNGGVSVTGSNRSDVLVRAQVQTRAPAGMEAKGIASQIQIASAGGRIAASAPDFGQGHGWSVSFEVLVPTRSDLKLNAHNGGVSITGVSGDIGFETVNGGVRLDRLAGNVHGATKNGGLSIELAGNRWDGQEFRAETLNGGVNITVPDGYSARLEASTINGRVRLDHPQAAAPDPDARNVSVTLGSGGPLVRATTRNGGIIVKRKS